ncbi:unnamed protein product [Miscanthus lutarioriparius]|uniref:DUF4218 domain-containing protein n=1 Tax=Miscanthus lutarioriparius TaxID=422564 RepID=A0A811Q1Q2_9POAL|nr:unnamed protein product [Miscanthus lutarioriparius]
MYLCKHGFREGYETWTEHGETHIGHDEGDSIANGEGFDEPGDNPPIVDEQPTPFATTFYRMVDSASELVHEKTTHSRFIQKIKKKVRNKACVEAAIVEAFLVEEATNFLSLYFKSSLPSIRNKMPRYDDGSSIFQEDGLDGTFVIDLGEALDSLVSLGSDEITDVVDLETIEKTTVEDEEYDEEAIDEEGNTTEEEHEAITDESEEETYDHDDD